MERSANRGAHHVQAVRPHKLNQLIKKQKWKRIFVYLADLHSEMANAIDL
nr:MAG TPA: Transcriptional regulator, AbiEi antitoxin, Type IV TA system [Caudoviricetes sp.]